MRDFNEGDQVSAMHLEHYPGMTEKSLKKIADEAQQRWVNKCDLDHVAAERWTNINSANS